MRVPTWIYFFLFVGLLVGNIHLYRAVFAPPVLKVSVLEVGKGSSVLVRSPSGKIVLVDVGQDASILRALGTALPAWQRSIDAIVLTSPKKAFSGGLPDVVSRYQVGQTFSSGSFFKLDGPVSIDILSPGVLIISYRETRLDISSSTPKGSYVSDGAVVRKI